MEYKNWDEGSTFTKISNQIRPLNKLGGNKGLQALSEKIIKNGSTLILGQAGIKTVGGNGISLRKDVIRTLSNQMTKQFLYSPVSYQQRDTVDPFYYLRSDRALEQFQRFLSRGTLPAQTGLSFDQVGSITYSNLHNNNNISRTETAVHFNTILEKASQKGPTMVSAAAMYSIGQVDIISNAPTQSSGYLMFTQDVPFYAMTLSGLVLMASPSLQQSGDPQRLFLEACGVYACIFCNYAE